MEVGPGGADLVGAEVAVEGGQPECEGPRMTVGVGNRLVVDAVDVEPTAVPVVGDVAARVVAAADAAGVAGLQLPTSR